MTSKMNDVQIAWKGVGGFIPANAVLPVIAKVEDILTIGELADAMVRKTVPLAKLSMAYGVILRAAGINVDDGDVYSDMVDKQVDHRFVTSSVLTLLMLILPSGDFRNSVVSQLATTHAGPEVPATAKKGASSRKSTKRRSSRKGGSDRLSSGPLQ